MVVVSARMAGARIQLAKADIASVTIRADQELEMLAGARPKKEKELQHG